MKIPITFLGTATAIPTAKRNHTAILVQHSGNYILFDCGEGTQRQLRKAKINPCKLTHILVTHWHGDHVFGIPGLLQTLNLNDYRKTLCIYGPKGTKRFMQSLSIFYKKYKKFKIVIKEIGKGKVFETKDFKIEAMPMKGHGIPCLAYAFIEKQKIRLNKSKIKKLKLPGKLLAKLSQGKNIKYKGKTIKASKITYKTQPKKISVIMDTSPNPNCKKIAKNSDILISEATYLNKEKGLGKKYGHLTAEQAAEIAKQANVKQLYLAHMSQRYDKSEHFISKEAKTKFKNTKIAEDLMKIEI